MHDPGGGVGTADGVEEAILPKVPPVLAHLHDLRKAPRDRIHILVDHELGRLPDHGGHRRDDRRDKRHLVRRKDGEEHDKGRDHRRDLRSEEHYDGGGDAGREEELEAVEGGTHAALDDLFRKGPQLAELVAEGLVLVDDLLDLEEDRLGVRDDDIEKETLEPGDEIRRRLVLKGRGDEGEDAEVLYLAGEVGDRLAGARRGLRSPPLPPWPRPSRPMRCGASPSSTP
jgi:hypothetical protein